MLGPGGGVSFPAMVLGLPSPLPPFLLYLPPLCVSSEVELGEPLLHILPWGEGSLPHHSGILLLKGCQRVSPAPSCTNWGTARESIGLSEGCFILNVCPQVGGSCSYRHLCVGTSQVTPACLSSAPPSARRPVPAARWDLGPDPNAPLSGSLSRPSRPGRALLFSSDFPPSQHGFCGRPAHSPE